MTRNAFGCAAAILALTLVILTAGGALALLAGLSPLLLAAAGAGLLSLLVGGIWLWFKLRPKPQQGLGPIVVHVANNASVSGSGNSSNQWR